MGGIAVVDKNDNAGWNSTNKQIVFGFCIQSSVQWKNAFLQKFF